MDINIVEMSRRSHYRDDSGFACGPCGVTVVDAEIVVSDNGHRVYLHAQWVDAACEDIQFSATEESVYELYARDDFNDVYDDIIGEIERRQDMGPGDWFDGLDAEERYEVQIADLKSLIETTLAENGINFKFSEHV